MSTLKDQLVKLGSKHKDLRPHLRPILAALKTARFDPEFHGDFAAFFDDVRAGLKRYLKKHVDEVDKVSVKGRGLSVTATIHIQAFMGGPMFYFEIEADGSRSVLITLYNSNHMGVLHRTKVNLGGGNRAFVKAVNKTLDEINYEVANLDPRRGT